jgi:chorismate mutase
MSTSQGDDPVLRQLREQISETDFAILAATNERLRLVAQVRAHKQSRGLSFLDPERERAMLEELRAANGGPLSEQGVEELLQMILDLCKREVTGRD